MDGINKELDDKIKTECMIKKALHEARNTVKKQRPVTRRMIENLKEAHDLKELNRIEQQYIDD